MMKRVRGDLGINQDMLADQALGSTKRKGDISRLENGHIPNPQAETIAKICAALGIDEAELDALHTDASNALDGQVERLLRENEALQAQLKISEALAVSLAYDFAESNPSDFDTAMRELRRAFEVAAEAKAADNLPKNIEDAVDQVIARVDALNDEGKRYLAAELIADEEAQMTKDFIRLFNKGIAQAILTRDVDAACAYELKKCPLAKPTDMEDYTYLRGVFVEWYTRGRDKGLNFDLEVAIALMRAMADCFTDDPDKHGACLTNLGVALDTLGERETSTARLEEAVAAYRLALEEFTRDRVPLDWAKTQMNLGNALITLGMRGTDTAQLEEAVTAYRLALEERTRDRVPLDWALTQMNLGIALDTLGERETGTARLEEAVAAHQMALEEFTRDRVPLDWAMTQMNLGNALKTLGTRETGTARLEQAVAAYRLALEEYTRDHLPLNWATTQLNLGNALQILGQRETGTARLEHAMAAYRLALEERTRDRVPLQWAMTLANLSAVELAFFHKTNDPAHLDRAMDHARAAREVYVEAQADHYIQWIAGHIAAIEAARPGAPPAPPAPPPPPEGG